MIACVGGVVVALVDAHHDGDVLVLGRRRDDDLLGTAVDVGLRLGRVGEEAGRLDDDVGADVAPRQGGGVALGEDLEGLAGAVMSVSVNVHVAVQPPEGGVVLEQGRERLVVGQVVDRDDLDVGAGGHAARKKLRPIRPNPLIPTRTVTAIAPRTVRSAGRDADHPVGRPASPSTLSPTRAGTPRCPSYVPVTSDRGREGSGYPSSTSMSGVSDASVSGMPSSSARLSAIASSRRIRPGDRVLGEHRVVQLTELLERGLLVLEPELAGHLAGGRGPPRRGSPSPGRPGRRRRRPHGPSGAGWRRRSWPAGWRWPAPRGASGAPPRPSATRGRRAGSAADRSRRRRGSPPGRRRAPRGPWRGSRAVRATPTRASAASGPGQVTSSADERPGSVSEPWARKAPRHAATASQPPPETTAGGSPRTGRPRWSSSPVWRASASPSLTTRTM